MITLIGVIIGALFLVLVVDVPRIALVAGFVAVILGALAVVLYHRRKLAELRELHTEHEGLYVLVSKAQRWPKRCVRCHHRIWSHREGSDHADPELSPCAAMAEAQEARELAADRAAAEAPGWTAEVIPGPRGGVDTLTDE
jgi:hypothetical protein